MKRVLILIAVFALGIGIADAAVRDGNNALRGNGAVTTTQQKRITTTDRVATPRTTVLGKTRSTTKSADTSRNIASRGTSENNARTATRSAQSTAKTIAPRAATANTTVETRTGALYEACKSAYFSCMDQFCSLKNDDYRRCSCSNRIDSLIEARNSLNAAGEQLTIFTENLDVVGMTAAQAIATRTASDGENALTSDTSASKALLQAIMNSIRGGDTTVTGKYSDLNSINMSFDTSTVFGNNSGQIVASYNGQNLYSAVYPQCREAVRQDCNDASLQRAVTAYLMAIEQDCNTVQTAIEQKQRDMKSAIREGSAMLDLARVENRRKHNTDDITTCINNVESAILSEEVCGANYHKCLDNGEYIDISTGAPITGVIKFYELGNLLQFNTGVDAALQKLSKISRNKIFVNNFEKRTKKFAKPALDKCTEIADEVWDEYLDKAMLAIYYAQQSKVSEIKQGCFDFVSQCYESGDASITMAMSQLLGTSTTILQPDKVTLTTQLCKDYVDSCNNMFDGDIVAQYVAMRESTDTLAACRAVVQQCFDKYGGTGYENFYYPYSGTFERGAAADWFTLYDTNGALKSPCAQQLAEISSCSDKDMIEKAFGGFDVFYTEPISDAGNDKIFTIKTSCSASNSAATCRKRYGIGMKNDNDKTLTLRHRELRSVGVATEIYNQIIDTLATQCTNIDGRFMEVQFLQNGVYDVSNYCAWHDTGDDADSKYTELNRVYGILANENMCPRDYNLSVDTQSWGACSCWGNGGRRSKNGRTATCVAVLPATTTDESDTNNICNANYSVSDAAKNDPTKWCTQNVTDSANRVCPAGYYHRYWPDANNSSVYNCSTSNTPDSVLSDAFFTILVPEGI